MKRYLAIIAAAWLMLAFAFLHTVNAAEQPIGQATVSVNQGDLNGRQSPDIHSIKVAWFQNGETISIYEVSGEWALTDGSEAGTCWVSIHYLVTEDAGDYTVTSNGRLRVRSTPDGDTIGWLKPGQTIDILAIFGDWARTDTGWVMAEYLERRED